MVRAKKNQTSGRKGRPAKSKPNKAVVHTVYSDKVLSTTELSNCASANDVDCSQSTNNTSSAKEIQNNNNKRSKTSRQAGNSANVKKSLTSKTSTSASTSKSNRVLIPKKAVSNVAVSKTTTASTSNNASLSQKTAIPQVLPTTGFPAKYVFIKLDRPPRIFENIKTVRSGPVISNSDVPLIVKRGCYDNSLVKILTAPSLTSQPNILQKDKSIESSVQHKDQNKKSHPVIVAKGQGNSTKPNVAHIQPAILQNSKSTEPSIQPTDKNHPNIVQKEQSSNIVQNIQPNDQNVSTVQSVNMKQSHLEKIQSEILNTKYLPIQPKPPGYQGTRMLFLTPSKPIKKPQKNRGLNNKYNCIVCEKKFLNPGTLLHHQRKLHRVFISSGQSCECRICGRILTSPQSRNKHELRFHPGKPLKKPHYKCPICLSNFQGMKSIKEHMSKDHSDINLEPLNANFDSKEEFEKWKVTLEGDTASQYVIRNRNRYPTFEKLEFACHRRSAINCNFKGTGKRKMKYKGSVKTGLFCPAFIMANIFPNNVQVTYNLTHLGHECDVEYIAMRKRIKSYQNCTLLRCRVCKKVFSQSTNRKHHEKEVHGLDVKYDLMLKCPICFTVFPTRKKIMNHFSKSHSYVNLPTTQLTFESLKVFNQWKSSMEQETKSEYVLDQVYQKSVCAFRRFNCHLSGSGEKKLFCPANVLLKLNPKEKSNVDVTYLSTHIGHSGENYQVTDKSESVSVATKCISAKDSHAAAVKVYQGVHVIKKDENTWVVLPFGNEDRVYEVKRLYIDPNHVCKFKCSSCNVCSHQFKCNCSVSCLKSVCIHIHIVCLKESQVEAEVSDNSCLDVDMNYYSEQEDSNHPENHVLQEIRGSHELNNLKEQAMGAVSTLITEIKNCNDEGKLKALISGVSNLKNKINSKHKLPPKRKDPVQKKRRVNDSQDNVLARVIQVAMQLENSDSPY